MLRGIVAGEPPKVGAVEAEARMTPDEEAQLHWIEAELLRRLEDDFVRKRAVPSPL